MDRRKNPTVNQPSHDELREQLNQLLAQRYGFSYDGMGPINPGVMPYVRDVFDKTFVYEHGGKLWRLSYSTDLRTDAVEISQDAPVQVRKVSSYKPVENEEQTSKSTVKPGADGSVEPTHGKKKRRKAKLTEVVSGHKPVENVFCKTGEGGGVDPSCKLGAEAGGGGGNRSGKRGKSLSDKDAESIAKKHLGIDTLKEQRSDRLDFHEVHVGGVKRALAESYGMGSGRKSSRKWEDLEDDEKSTLTSIAKDRLFIDTLETRRSDSLDFHQVSVQVVKDALQAAHDAGNVRKKKSKPTNNEEEGPPHDTIKGGSDMTENQRKELIDSLITNCDCGWAEEDRPLLNGMSDDQLVRVQKQGERFGEAEVVANAAREGFEDERGNSHRYNPAESRWESVLKPVENAKGGKMYSEDDCKKMMAQNALTAEQIEDLAFARAVKQERKDAMIATITANAKNPFSSDELNGMSLDQLHKLATLAHVEPKAEEPKRNLPIWMGAAVPTGNQEPTVNKSDTLDVPEVDWASLAGKN